MKESGEIIDRFIKDVSGITVIVDGEKIKFTPLEKVEPRKDGNGFKVTFPNNSVVFSTQWTPFNYCGNKNLSIRHADYPLTGSCSTAEIAMWDGSGAWITKKIHKRVTGEAHNDDVVGWVEPTEWMKYLEACRRCKI